MWHGLLLMVLVAVLSVDFDSSSVGLGDKERKREEAKTRVNASNILATSSLLTTLKKCTQKLSNYAPLSHAIQTQLHTT